MSSNEKASEEKSIEKPDSSKESLPKNNSKETSRDDFDKELENYHEKKKNRNTVYTHRILKNPQITDANSVFEFNMLDNSDFLKKKHLFIISKYEQILLLSSDINKKLEENSQTIDELNNDLIKLKQEKKQKQSDIVNYLSNKESLEEIYKNKLRYIINKKEEMKSKLEEKEINLNLDSSKNKNQDESEYYDIDLEKEIEIKIEEIKNSDQDKFTEQVINFVEEIFNKKEEKDLIEKIKSKIKIAYNIFFSEISSNIEINNDSIISNFFSRIGLFISNHSLGLYSEININKFLRYLLKINSINSEILRAMKFLNKKYKEQKGEIKNKINNLKEANENLKEKKNINDIKIEKYEKIIQKNKELINNAKQNENENSEEKKGKRRYTVHTLDRSHLRRGNNMNVGGKEEVIINQSDIKTKPKKSKFYQTKEKESEKGTSNKNNNEANSSQSEENKNNIRNNREKSGEYDSNINNKNQDKIDLSKQKVIVIKNNINIKNNEGNNEINNIPSNNSNQNIKYNENIYIINNINNSEQVQTKNNIYNNKSSNININSNNNYNDKSQVNNRKIYNSKKNDNTNVNNQNLKITNNYESQNINQDKEIKNRTYNNSQGKSQINQRKNNINNTQNTNSSNTDSLNKKPDNVMNNKNTGYKISVVPKRSEKKSE